jgi:sterol 3beta-glucosyltransferase
MCKDDPVRVLIVTSGSMGDVAPYTGLGVRLKDAGHEVTVATHRQFADTIAAAGLPFLPLPGDLRAILPQARGQDGRTSGTDPRALIELMRIARPLIADLGAGIAAAAAESRAEVLLLSTLVAPLGYQVAEAGGIPWAGVFLQPLHPTRAFGSVLTGGRSLGPWGNLASAHLVQTAAAPLYAGPIRALRADLGLPRESRHRLETRQIHRHPTFHAFSTAVVPRPSDWPASQQVIGYLWPARPPAWTPPRALADFLAAGPPPAFIGFGSMAPGTGTRLTTPLIKAIRAAGLRAIIQSGWADLEIPESDDILPVGPLPHDWLFPRTSAVVHHAGAGTTAAALRAGVPAIPVPVLADQPFWARRLHTLGVSPAPIPFRHLTAANLARALRETTGNPHRAARAQALSSRLTTDDAPAEILTWLDSLSA